MTTKIYITLGDGASLGIDDKDQLFITQDYGTVPGYVHLGLATNKRFEQLLEYLQRLEIHAIEEKVL